VRDELIMDLWIYTHGLASMVIANLLPRPEPDVVDRNWNGGRHRDRRSHGLGLGARAHAVCHREVQSKEEDMNALLMNGNPNPADPRFDAYLQSLAQVLTVRGHGVNTLELRSMTCASAAAVSVVGEDARSLCDQDQHGQLIRAYLDADVAVLASPLVLGSARGCSSGRRTSSSPSFCPTSTLRRESCRQLSRYPKTAATGGVVSGRARHRRRGSSHQRAKSGGRMARNANTSLIACLSTTMATTEVAHAIARAYGSPADPSPTRDFSLTNFLRGFAVTPAIKLKPGYRAAERWEKALAAFWNSDAVLSAFHCTRTPCPAW